MCLKAVASPIATSFFELSHNAFGLTLCTRFDRDRDTADGVSFLVPGRTRYGPTHLLCPKAGGQIGCVCPENQIPEHAGGTPLDLVWNTRGVHLWAPWDPVMRKKSGRLRKMEQGLVTVCFDFEMDLAQSHQVSVKQV